MSVASYLARWMFNILTTDRYLSRERTLDINVLVFDTTGWMESEQRQGRVKSSQSSYDPFYVCTLEWSFSSPIVLPFFQDAMVVDRFFFFLLPMYLF